MADTLNKHSYKGISLLIKTAILIFSFYYIWQKISVARHNINLNALLIYSDKAIIISSIVLMFLNWGLEALKWKLLISSLERISFLRALQSVFAGVTVSIFTPGRVGEFVGRIFFLEKADKIQASLKSFIGSFTQLMVTVVAGLLAYFVLRIHYENYFKERQLVTSQSLFVLILFFTLLTAAVLFIYKKRNDLFSNYKKYIDTFTECSFSQLFAIAALSIGRYLVFSFQYFLILNFFGINDDAIILFSLIALTFFVTSVIPTFSLTEIAVRGATAVFLFGFISSDSNAIVASSILLWVINLAIPSVIGSVFVLKLKLFKD